jgi:hypothetical protein
MDCPACQLDPKTHSFQLLGEEDGAKTYYTAPALATGDEPNDIRTANFRKHLDTAVGGPWIWLFDCKDMDFRHYVDIEFVFSLVEIYEDDHVDYLQKIVILNPNLWVMGILTVLKTFVTSDLFDKIIYE